MDDNNTTGNIAITPTRFTEYDAGFSFSASLTKSQLDRLSTNELPLILNAIHNRYRGRQTMTHGFVYGFPMVFDGREFAKGFIYTFGDVVLGDY